MILSKEQRIAASILFGLTFAVWLGIAIWPKSTDTLEPPTTPTNTKKSWSERRDSIRLADSLRYAQWTEERQQRYDSFRLVDSLRFIEWSRVRQARYDSFRHADSLWHDSVGWFYAAHIKKDTILNLNTCDTTELQYLRGIGHFTAKQIIRYREQLGGFYSLQQLNDEPLAKFHLDTLAAHFILDSTAIQTMNVNSLSIERLQRHPYLRFKQAQAIYNLRRKQIKLKSIEDLRSLPELTEEDLIRLTPYLRFN